MALAVATSSGVTQPAWAGTWVARHAPSALSDSETQELAPGAVLPGVWNVPVEFGWEPDQGETMQSDPPPPQVRLKLTCEVSWSSGPFAGTANRPSAILASSARSGARRASAHATRLGQASSDPKLWRLMQRGSGGGGNPPATPNKASGGASVGFSPQTYSPKPAASPHVSGVADGVKWVVLDSRSGTVEYDLTGLSAHVQADPGNTGGWGGTVGFEVTAEISPRDVWISSTIDQSYVKSLSPSSSVAAQPSPPSIPGTDPPAWKVEAPQEGVVHSAAEWSDDTKVWIGSASFTSNETGFNLPVNRVWTANGGTPADSTVSNRMANGFNPIAIPLLLGAPEMAAV